MTDSAGLVRWCGARRRTVVKIARLAGDSDHCIQRMRLGGAARCHVSVTTGVKLPGFPWDMVGTFALVSSQAGLSWHLQKRDRRDLKSAQCRFESDWGTVEGLVDS